jgi:hypothetical protein
MKSINEPDLSSRRGFLRQIVVLGGASGLAGLAVNAVTATETTRATTADDPVPANRGYHETDHIRTYYEKAEF